MTNLEKDQSPLRISDIIPGNSLRSHLGVLRFEPPSSTQIRSKRMLSPEGPTRVHINVDLSGIASE